MPAPIAVAIAATVTRALAMQAAKQGVKQLTKNEARIVAKKAVRQIAAKSRSQSDKSRAVSGKQLDALINKANLSARSTKPVRNAKGLRTTTGQGGKRISNVSATRIAEQSAGPKARRLGGEAALRGKSPKPGVRITRKTSGGEVTRTGTPKKVNLKVTKRAEGPSRPVVVKKTVTKGRIVRDVKSTDFVKPLGETKNISGKVTPFVTKEKTTVTRPVKRSTNRNGSAVTVRKTEPRKAADVRAQRAKERRDTLREALTPRVNPARPKTTPKRGTSGSSGRNRTPSQDVLDRYYRIRFGDRGGPTPRSAQGPQSSIESRLASGSEKAPKGSSRSSNFDSEAESLLNRSIRAIENPKVAAKERVTPGKATKTTIALRTVGGTKGAKAAKLKGTIRNQRKVLKQREIKEAAERMRKAEEAAKKRGTK